MLLRILSLTRFRESEGEVIGVRFMRERPTNVGEGLIHRRYMRAFRTHTFVLCIHMHTHKRYDPTRGPPRTTDHRMDATAAKLRDAQLPPLYNRSKTTPRSPVAPIKGAIKFLWVSSTTVSFYSRGSIRRLRLSLR